MFPATKAKQLVKPTLDRFVEDRLAELGLTHEDLVTRMGDVLATEYKIHRLTRRINSPQFFPAAELDAFAQALGLKDWFGDLVVNFGAGLDGFLIPVAVIKGREDFPKHKNASSREAREGVI